MLERKIMIFKPSYEEFKDFNQYIKFMESQGAYLAGVAKVIPPPEWKPRSGSYDMTEIGDTEIHAPISQVVYFGKDGVYKQCCSAGASMSVRDFKKMVESDEFCKDRPPFDDNDKVVSAYWDKVTTSEDEQRIYGADVKGSLMDANLKVWNINKLESILEKVSKENNINTQGVNRSHLYFGSWKTTFAWHVEDMDLYSINYLHFGAPKTWYAIPPSHGCDFEQVAAYYFPDDSRICNAFLRHKTVIISPDVLQSHGIPVNTITQEAGEIIITWPYGYHAGFNQGFNCAEATNFATERWIEYGKHCTQCSCEIGSVEFPMEAFVRKFQNDQYENWRNEQDIGERPEIRGEQALANLPDGFVKTTPKNCPIIKETLEPLLFTELADDHDDDDDDDDDDEEKESNKTKILDDALLNMTKTRLSRLLMQGSNFRKCAVKMIARKYKFYARNKIGDQNPENIPIHLQNQVLEEFSNYLKIELSWSVKIFNLRLAMFRRLINSDTRKVDLTGILYSCKSKTNLEKCLIKLLNVLLDKASNLEELTIGANSKAEDVTMTKGIMTRLAKLKKLKSLKISPIFKFKFIFDFLRVGQHLPNLQVISASVKGPVTSPDMLHYFMDLDKCFPSLIVHFIKSSHNEPWLKKFLDRRCRLNAKKLGKVYQTESKIFNWDNSPNMRNAKLSRHTVYTGTPGQFRRVLIEVEERSKDEQDGNMYHTYYENDSLEQPTHSTDLVVSVDEENDSLEQPTHTTDLVVPVDEENDSQDATRFNSIHFVDGGVSFPEAMKVNNKASCWPKVHTFTMGSVNEMAKLELEISAIAERCPKLEKLIIKDMFNVYIVKEPELNALTLPHLRVLDLVVQAHQRTILPSHIFAAAPNLERVRLVGTAEFFTIEDLEVVMSKIAKVAILSQLQKLQIAIRAVPLVDDRGETLPNDYIPDENVKQVILLLKTASAFLPRLTAIKLTTRESCGWQTLATRGKMTSRGKKRKIESIDPTHSFRSFLEVFRQCG